MSKRAAIEEGDGAATCKKRLIDSAYCPPLEDQDETFTASTAHTPASTADIESTATGVTTPRPKFPSDLKTLACTWPGCPKSFNRPARLRDHLNSHTNSRPFKCPYGDCDKDYIEDKHLKQHIKAVHTHDRKYVCQKEGCGKSFVTGTRLKRHQAVHEGEERFKCHDCGQSFRKRETLSKHVRKDHQGLPAHQCPDGGCARAFDSKNALNRHREREHGELKYWCGDCGLSTLSDGSEHRVGFTTESLLQAHIRQEHQNCMFCEFKSATRADLEQHVEVHHSGRTVQERKIIPCPHEGCAKKFTKRSNMNAHVRAAHEGLRFVCGEVTTDVVDLAGWTNELGCGDKFVTKMKLEEHIRYVHLGHERSKISKPDTILDLISDVSGVANHRRQAQATSCPECGQKFFRITDLENHVQMVHTSTNDADPADFLSHDQLGTDFPASEHDLPFDATAQEEIFAAQMDYDQPKDDWLEDEANILLLARAPPELDIEVDPALTDW